MSGAEIFGIAASAIGVAEIGLKVSVSLFEYTRKIKRADKDIDALSHEIAATGAVIQQLGGTLQATHKSQLRLPKYIVAAVLTAKGLVEDCERVFDKLGQFTSSKVDKISFKQRVTFPFVEKQIEELKANLERLKSSLLVILNVLILYGQSQSHTAIPILEEQQLLLKSLIDEKALNEKRYHDLINRIGNGGDGNPAFASNASSSNTVTAAQRSPPVREMDQTGLPLGMAHHQTRIHDHSLLVTQLLDEIALTKYKIDHTQRSDLHDCVLEVHWNTWSSLRRTYGDEVFAKMLENFEHVNFYWNDQRWNGTPRYSETKGRSAASNVDVSETYMSAHNHHHHHHSHHSRSRSRSPSTRSIVLVNNSRTDMVDAERPTWIRIARRHILPETLNEYGLHWSYDPDDDEYIVIKQYIDHDLQREIFAHTKRIMKSRKLITEGYTKETITTLRPGNERVVKSKNDQIFLVRRRSKSPARDRRSMLGLDTEPVPQTAVDDVAAAAAAAAAKDHSGQKPAPLSTDPLSPATVAASSEDWSIRQEDLQSLSSDSPERLYRPAESTFRKRKRDNIFSSADQTSDNDNDDDEYLEQLEPDDFLASLDKDIADHLTSYVIQSSESVNPSRNLKDNRKAFVRFADPEELAAATDDYEDTSSARPSRRRCDMF